MDDNFSPRVKDVISFSKEEALRLGHDYIGTEHLMLGILRDGGGKAITILNAIEVDLDNLRKLSKRQWLELVCWGEKSFELEGMKENDAFPSPIITPGGV